MEWSIQEIARLAGVTSRTLRHYDDLGLLPPSRIGGNGYRYYDEAAVARLQRVLLLRELGVGLGEIGRVLQGGQRDAAALAVHAEWLEQEQQRLARQLDAVRRTIEALEGGDTMTAAAMLDGFDHTRYREEVAERWGAQAWADSDRWWRSLGAERQARFREETAAIIEAWRQAHAAGLAPDSDQAQALAERQWRWIEAAWGGKELTAEAFIGLGELYVADPRFGANYRRAEGDGGPEFVRDAMRVHAERRTR